MLVPFCHLRHLRQLRQLRHLRHLRQLRQNRQNRRLLSNVLFSVVAYVIVYNGIVWRI